MTEAERVKRLQEEAKKNVVNGDVGKFLIFSIMCITVSSAGLKLQRIFIWTFVIPRKQNLVV